jgi:hypothetical protein
MFLRRQGEVRRLAPFETPRRHLGEYKASQGDTISVKNERNKGKTDKARIGKAARTLRALARLDT